MDDPVNHNGARKYLMPNDIVALVMCYVNAFLW